MEWAVTQIAQPCGEICNGCDRKLSIAELYNNRCSGCGNVLSGEGATRLDPDDPESARILAAAVAAQSDPEPDPEPEQPDAGDEDHRGTGTTIDDILSGREDDPE